ncbi:MAG: histidine triad nucleotide-binding protein [Chlamydiales bacterium]|nr:histidine triad nucleotide-binding protein [Chlamydiales bacterium]
MASQEKTIFEKIISGELPSEKVYEDDDVVAIKDKFPKAPIHLLIITKKVIPSVQEIEESDFPLLGKVTKVAQKLAKEFGLGEGYRLVTNVGPQAGQTIFHLHFHLMGGHYLGEMG